MPFSPGPAAAAASAPAGASYLPHVYNWSPGPQFLNWRTASAKVRNGIAGARCPIAIYGDSTSAGHGANGVGQNDVGVRNLKSWPSIMASLLNGNGLSVTQQNFFSGGNLTGADTRVVLTGSASFGGATMFGGGMINNGAAGDTAVFTPGGTQNFDRVDVHYMDFGDAFTIQVGSQTAQTITPGITQTPKLVTLSFTSAAPTTAVTITMPTHNTNPFIAGLRCWNSTTPAVELMNGAISGYTIQASVGVANYSYIKSIVQLAPALTIINMGINDANGSRTAAQYQTDMTTAITQLQTAKSDIILVVPTPTQEGGVPATHFGTASAPGDYTLALQSLSTTYNIPLVSMVDRYGLWTPLNTAGMMYDSLHPNGNMHADEGAFMARLIGSI